MAEGLHRVHLDLEDYAKRSQANPCFICKIVEGAHHFPHGEIYRDDFAVAFLSRFPTLLGYTLVAPLDHRVSIVNDFTEEEHLRMQALVHRVGRAIASTVPTERLYVMSLGSNQGNAHVHWHLAPLPPGVPYEEQQFAALMMESKGYIELTPAEHNELADRISSSMTS
jgi:diadenosine tetraphosphate (Ap4A) HIT family hydrolase